MDDLAAEDLVYIANHNHDDISDAEQGRTEQLVTYRQLRNWLSTPASTQLLIHGGYDYGLRPVSGLSLFCATLAFHIDSRPRMIRLIFFCGLHAEDCGSPLDDGSDDGSDDIDDYPPEDASIGGLAVVSSLIGQLLCAFDFGPELPVERSSEDAVIHGDVDVLCDIFCTLVRRLPADVVLVCIVDGVDCYERPFFLAETYSVLENILRLSVDNTVAAVMKVLITASTQTRDICEMFTPNRILSMAAMADAQWEPSRSRVKRVLEEEDQFEEAG